MAESWYFVNSAPGMSSSIEGGTGVEEEKYLVRVTMVRPILSVL